MYRSIVLLGLSLALTAFAQVPDAPANKEKDTKAVEKKSLGDDIDVHKTAERIADNAQKAGERLKGKDPGSETRKLQDEIIKDIDALIKKAQQPPPSPPMSSDMSPMMPPPMGNPPMPKSGMGGGPMPKSPMGGGAGSGMQPKKEGNAGRSGRRERRPRGGSPMGMGEPMADASPKEAGPMPAKIDPKNDQTGKKDNGEADGADRFGKPSPRRENDKLADLYKDVWGHLPERMRQEMDLYYRDQFMPRYTELLRRYYAALAEQRKKDAEDR